MKRSACAAREVAACRRVDVFLFTALRLNGGVAALNFFIFPKEIIIMAESKLRTKRKQKVSKFFSFFTFSGIDFLLKIRKDRRKNCSAENKYDNDKVYKLDSRSQPLNK